MCIPAGAAPSRFELDGAGGGAGYVGCDGAGYADDAVAERAGRGVKVCGQRGILLRLRRWQGPSIRRRMCAAEAYHLELGRRNFAAGTVFLTGNLLDQDHHNGTPIQTNATRLWRYLAGYDLPESGAVTARVRGCSGSDEGYRQTFSSINAVRTAETLTRLQRVHTQELGATGGRDLAAGAGGGGVWGGLPGYSGGGSRDADCQWSADRYCGCDGAAAVL